MSDRSKEFHKARIAASEIQVGDRLDMSGKVRVHAVKKIGENIVAAHRLRGSKSPSITSYDPDDQVTVWRG